MVSNANVTQEVKDAFKAVTKKEARWAIAKVEGDSIVHVASGPREHTIADLHAALGDTPCYVVVDFDATREDGSTLCKTCFIAYSPDSCRSMQDKFALQNFRESVKSGVMCHKEMQINDKADCTENEFREQFGLN